VIGCKIRLVQRFEGVIKGDFYLRAFIKKKKETFYYTFEFGHERCTPRASLILMSVLSIFIHFIV
jgi:hypothetical protein